MFEENFHDAKYIYTNTIENRCEENLCYGVKRLTKHSGKTVGSQIATGDSFTRSNKM